MSDNSINIIVKAVDEASKTFGQIETAAGSTISQIDKMRTSLAGLAAGAGFAGIAAKIVNDAGEYAGAVKQISGLTGETTEGTSKMMAQFQYFGMSTETATGSLAKFGKNIATAREEMIKSQVSGKQSSDAFSKIGLTLADITKGSTIEVFQKVQEKMRGMTDAAEKDRIAMELFGKSGYQMMAMLNATPEEVQSVIDQFEAMGLIMDEDSVNAAVHLNREFNVLKGTATRLSISLGNELVPALSGQITAINDVVGSYAAMDSTSRSVIANTVLMGVEFGTINIVIGTLTKSLEAMGIAVKVAFGKWLLLAEALIMAGVALHTYATEEANWVNNHTYESGGRNYYVGKDGKSVYKEEGGENASVLEDPTGSSVSANNGEIDEATKADVLAQNQAKEQAEADEKKRKQDEETNKKLKEIQDKTANILNSINQNTEKAGKNQQQAMNNMARAQQQVAEAMQRNAQLIKQANDRVESIINSLQNQLLDLNGTQRQIDESRAKNEYFNTIKNINAAAVQLKSVSLKMAGAANGGNLSTAQNWTEKLLSGDDAIDTFTAQKLHLLSQKYYELTGEQPTVTSMHRYGDGSSDHDTGHAFDFSTDKLESSADLRQQLMAYAKTIGLNPLDEYDQANWKWGQYNVHFSDRGAPIEGITGGGTASVTSNNTPAANYSDEIKAIIAASQQQNFEDIKLAIAVAMTESGGNTVEGINNASVNPNSGARGMFQILSGQDVSDGYGGRTDIDKLYPDLGTDKLQNAMAGITMLKDKIAAAGGDLWEGVKHYGEGTQEYVNKVKANYDSLGNMANMASLSESSKLFIPARSGEAKTLAATLRDEKLAKAAEDEAKRARKQQAEIDSIMASLDGNREGGIDIDLKQKQQENFDSENEYYKQSGNLDQAHQLFLAKNLQNERDAEQKRRELRKTEEDETQQTYDNELSAGTAYNTDVDTLRKQDYQRYLEYLNDQLSNYDLTTAQRVELETQASEKIKQIREIEAKSYEGAVKQLTETMKNFSVDAGSVMQDGWSNAVETFTSSFDNILTSSESGAERLRNLYINLANDILNVMMKIILRGLIMNTIMKAFGMGSSSSIMSGYGSSDVSDFIAGNGGGFDSNAFQTSDVATISGFADGGYAGKGMHIVGERGIELADFQNPGRVYTNDELSKAISGSNSGNLQKVDVQIINQTGQNVEATSANVSFDGEKYIIATVIKAVGNNTMGLKSMLKGASK